MVVGQVDGRHVAAAGGQRAGRNATRASLQAELADNLLCLCVPDVHRGLRACLSRHNCLSVRTDIDGKDVISMVRLFGVLVLRAHRRDFLATVELLRASISVHDDSQRGNHVDSLALGCVPQVLLAVCGAVAVDVLDLKFSLRRFLGGLLNAKKR